MAPAVQSAPPRARRARSAAPFVRRSSMQDHLDTQEPGQQNESAHTDAHGGGDGSGVTLGAGTR